MQPKINHVQNFVENFQPVSDPLDTKCYPPLINIICQIQYLTKTITSSTVVRKEEREKPAPVQRKLIPLMTLVKITLIIYFELILFSCVISYIVVIISYIVVITKKVFYFLNIKQIVITLL